MASNAAPEVVGRPRRDDILIAAARMFNERGYQATSVRDIAAGCDMRVGSLYHHFASKNEMLAELVVRYYQTLVPELHAIMETRHDGATKLTSLVTATLEVSMSRRFEFMAMFTEWKLVQQTPQLDTLVADRDRSLEMTRAAIRQGIADRSLRADLDIDATLIVVVAGIAGIVDHRHEFAPLARGVDPILAYVDLLRRAVAVGP